MDAQQAFVRREMVAPMAPPRAIGGVFGWMHERLFAGVANSILTIVSAVLLVLLIWPTVRFLLIDAVWTGSSRADCLPETVGREVGACWPFIKAKFTQFMYGFYPASEQWRGNITSTPRGILLVPLLLSGAPREGVKAALFFWVVSTVC